ncbi:hypothetical protein [Nesterenkonia alba]|uniref:arsenate reductase/protein-tyrosine-phosphatase family protein n=1 Tax=Nesterenkonia alba TaxID=515814 RepID=UPI0004018CEA|nr:hypothetical protein [Nesterenkonia alba]
MAEPYTILAVCTGNICRSPAMERLLAQVFADDADVEVISAGTFAHQGWDMQDPMKERVAAYGADTGGFVAQQVTETMIREADLILTATGEHIADMAAEVPAAREKMFTLPEFGRLIAETEPDHLPQGPASEQLAALVAVAGRARTETPSAQADDDVVDPYMLPDDVYDASFGQIREPIETLARLLNRG